MKRMYFPSSVIVLASCLAAPASADWEFTKWGMTKAEVQQSAKDHGIKLETSRDDYVCSNRHSAVAFKAEYRLDDFSAPACLLFDRETGFLRWIKIPLPDPTQKQHLQDLLTKKYGGPFKTEELIPGILPVTTWLAPDARITISSIGDDSSTLDFEPREDFVGDGW